MNAEKKQCPPVAIFGFNRPDCLTQVFELVRLVRPKQLFLVLDAPRENRPDDVEKWEECKKIFDSVDWACDVHRNYAKDNLGCRWRMTTGISWVFEHVEEAILLEDDCVPHIDFFPFCGELLDRYKGDTRIGMVAGMLRCPQKNKATSYYFDRYPAIWGWATWRRAWACFDQKMTEWPRFKESGNLRSVLGRDRLLVKTVSGFYDGVYNNSTNSWATAWWLTFIRQGFLCAHASVNLVTNIGVVGAHSHQCGNMHFIANGGLSFPLTHPVDFIPDYEEERLMQKCYTPDSLMVRIRRRLWRFL